MSSTVPAGTQPQDVAVGDFNNDGRDDLAVVNSGSHNVTVRFGAGDGTFATEAGGSPFPAAANGDLPQAIAVADFNGDGNEDLAVPDWNVGKVTVLLGAGGGAFGAGVQYATGCITPNDVAVGDLNNDGNDDLAVSCTGGVMVRLGAADGTLNTVPTGSPFSAGSGLASAVAIGDFDNDGKADLAVTNQGAGNVTVRLGAGDGTFATQATGSPFGIGPAPKSIAVGDFNADNNEDIAVGNYADPGTVSVRLGFGNGTFNAVPLGSPYSTGPMPWGVGVGDFNSDGREDLAIANQGGSANGFSGGITVRLGAGDGTFTAEAAGSPYRAGSTSRGIAVGDFNADGNGDLAMPNAGNGNVAIRLGAGSPPLAGNLLANGGFEGAGAAREPTVDPPPPIPGWSRTGTMTAARYGMRFSSIFPSHLDSPRFLTGGMNYLFGGPSGASSTAFQTADVSASAASIDAGLATARLSAYLGGGSVFSDSMQATGTFLDGSGAQLGSFTIGPVAVADRKNLSTLLPRAGSSALPAGTRSILVTLTATNADASGDSAFADNVKLTLDAPAPPEGGGGGDGGGGGGGGGATDLTPPETIKVGKGPKHRTHRRTARFRFSSEPGATFQCSLDREPFQPCTSPDRVKHLKRRKHVFQARAVDAAGNVDPAPATWRFRVVRRRR
jgi:hypothetical protein